MNDLLDTAHTLIKDNAWKNPFQFAIHLEPYPGRSVVSIREDIEYIITQYVRKYPSLFAVVCGKPLVYIYDSYHIAPEDWAMLFHANGELSIRSTEYDVFAIGLWLYEQHGNDLYNAGFNGIYTYFATDGFSYGSTTRNWKEMKAFCDEKMMVCSFSVGPGYDDSKIRPWNAQNKRNRR